MRRVAWQVVLVGMVVSCASFKGGDNSSDTGTWDDLGDSGDPTDTSVDGGDDVPMWWLLNAPIEVSEGALDPSRTTLEVAVLDDGLGQLCSVVSAAPEMNDVGSLPDPVIYTWWSVQPGEWTGDCERLDVALPVPDRFRLGIGEMHPEIQAVLGSLDGVEPGAESSLNGAYASFDRDETIYVFGAAGPVVAFDAVGESLQGPPLSDGTWQVRAIYPFSISMSGGDTGASFTSDQVPPGSN